MRAGIKPGRGLRAWVDRALCRRRAHPAMAFLATGTMQHIAQVPPLRPLVGEVPRYRALFLSDLHLGSAGARPRELLRFLRGHHADTIYLVGDIFDIWHVRFIHWTNAHDALLSELARRAANGTRLVYLPGNHDSAMRNFVQMGGRFLKAGMVELTDTATHLAADGKRYLVLHGDQCDARMLKWHLATRLGSRAEARMHALERWLQGRSGSQAGRGMLEAMRKTANSLVLAGNRFETRLVMMARAGGHDGVICGHSHRPAIRNHDGIAYVNCGDWVDSMTAVAEHADGRLEILQWQAKPGLVALPRAARQRKLV